jgi:hypothetical protein
MTDLAHDLTQQARVAAGAANGRVRREVLPAALDAARAWGGSQRGWALVRLAAALRDNEGYCEALAFLDLADEKCRDPHVTRAVFTCAIAIHCDQESIEMANTLSDEQRLRMPGDEQFLRAEIRARTLWLEETGEQAALEALDRAKSELELLTGSLAGSHN